jgi:hypothetical protein
MEQLDAEHQRLEKRLGWIRKRREQLSDARKTLEPLLEPPPSEHLLDAGLTGACRQIFANSPRPLSAREVRDLLQQRGVALEYSNPMAALHATLRRIATAGKNENGETVYDTSSRESRSDPRPTVRITARKADSK